VWREGASGQCGPPAPLRGAEVAARPDGAGGTFAEAVPESADQQHLSDAAPSAGSAYGGADPVGTFLRINDTLDRLAGKPAPAPGTPLIGPDGKPLDPNTRVPFKDDNGDDVLGPDHKPMLRPAGADPHFFVEQGVRDRETVRKILNEANGPDTLVALPGYNVVKALLFQTKELFKFRQYGDWEAQRINKVWHEEFVDYATVAIRNLFVDYRYRQILIAI